MAVNFDGSFEQMLEKDSASITAPPLSMVAWFKASKLNQSATILRLCHDTFVDDQFTIRLEEGATDRFAALAGDFGSGEESAVTTTDYLVDTWHHGAGVFTAADDRAAFLDGGNKGTNVVSKTPTNTVNRTRIGNRNNFDASIEADIAEVAIYNIALSDAEVLVLASGMSPLSVRPEALLHYWPLHGRTGRVAF